MPVSEETVRWRTAVAGAHSLLHLAFDTVSRNSKGRERPAAPAASASPLDTDVGDVALNVFLVVTVAAAVLGGSYLLVTPGADDAHTELYLLTENETGDLVASDYPTEFREGQGRAVVVGVENREGARETYSVVVLLQKVRVVNNSSTVSDERALQTFRVTAAPGETKLTEANVTPSLTGDRLRLAFLLYRDSPPERPGLDNAYREVHLWINVTEAT